MPKKNREISTREGLLFGATMLGQITAILVITALAGLAIDATAHTAPLFLGAGVLAGSLGATVTVLIKVRRKLTD